MPKITVPTTADLFEDISYTDGSLPIHLCTDHFCDFLDHEINCHWHNDFEFAYMKKGSCSYDFHGNGEKETLREGDGVFVNSKTLHSAIGLTEDAVMECFTVSPFFFGADMTSAVYINSIYPLLTSSISGFPLYQTNKEDKKLLVLIQSVIAVNPDEKYHDLLYTETLSRLWRHLLDKAEAISIPADTQFQQQRAAKARLMLSYLHANYGSDITVEDLASYLSISRTECFRIFKQNIGKSPIDYLLCYRLSQAARLLISTEKTVSEIYESCGFHSGSYFSGKFRQFYKMTPKDYRRLAGN